MKLVHSIEISVFSKPEDDLESVKNGLIQLIPFNLEDNKIELKETNATSFHEREIKILEVHLQKDKHTTQFINWLVQQLNEHTKQTIITQLESRLDEHLHFYLRFDKNKWITDKQLFLVDHGDCYHLKITFAVFPKKRDLMIKKIKEVFS
ncbi:hypothetical protein COV11_03845 [Candidatus Woesearchaeota archaeon CG10_big_fil_rev_8_21_14_0_10_30_7]|nr:MAG: hypothetical protein COV11_03845 [Candidatus Woesearchaeota archaeon CG10_big_fil_rev_8_21_14_0_10_30_7]